MTRAPAWSLVEIGRDRLGDGTATEVRRVVACERDCPVPPVLLRLRDRGAGRLVVVPMRAKRKIRERP